MWLSDDDVLKIKKQCDDTRSLDLTLLFTVKVLPTNAEDRITLFNPHTQNLNWANSVIQHYNILTGKFYGIDRFYFNGNKLRCTPQTQFSAFC